LEAEGYEVQPFILPAASVNAPHKRDRVWFVAYSKSAGNRKLKTANKGKQNRFNNNNGKTGPAPDTKEQGLQGGEKHRSIGGIRQNSNEQPTRFIQPNWEKFPTESPFHMRDDGIPKKLAIFVVKEFYDTDSYTSQENRIENLHEVWGRISQEEVWEKVRRLYSLDTKEILFQTMQLYSSGYENKRRLSPFSEEVSKEPMRILRKYKKFASSPQGQELAKQRYGEYSDIMCDLPHEVALAARAYTNSIRKFEAWHRQESIKAAGNAIVPQVVFQIFKAINEYREKYP
jgi:DNA (cytosine-5)-methyltransferase 1